MNVAARALWNPIVAKEYRSRMRTWRSPLAITIYIVLLGGLGWAVFAALASAATAAYNPGAVPNYGQQLFEFLILFQVALVAFVTPALTSGAISGERERQTIDLLFVTPLPPFSIIWGKLLASMSFVVLLLAISVPIFSLVFLFGGIELDQMVLAYLVTASTTLMLAVVGIAFSALFRRTLASTVASYGAAFVLLVGTLVWGLLFPTDVDASASTAPAPPAVTMLGPVLPLFTIANNQPVTGYGIRYSTPQWNGYAQSAGTSCVAQPGGGMACYGGGPVMTYPAKSVGISGATGPQNATIPSGLFKGWQYWQASIVMQLMVSLVAIVFAATVLPPVRRFHLLRRARPTAGT